MIFIKNKKKLQEIEADLFSEQKNHQDTIKELHKTDRRLKDFGFQSEEDKKVNARLQKHIEKLEAKMKTLRRHVEETEEIAALNLAKYRNAQQDMEAAYERADVAENQLTKMRANRRAESMAPRASSPQVKFNQFCIVK